MIQLLSTVSHKSYLHHPFLFTKHNLNQSISLLLNKKIIFIIIYTIKLINLPKEFKSFKKESISFDFSYFSFSVGGISYPLSNPDY